jgi:hypothetical protein
MSQNGELSERLNAQQTQSEHETGMGLAAEEARKKEFDPEELQSREFLEAFTDPDLDRDYPDEDDAQFNLEQFLSGELTQQLQFGQLTREEWREEKQMDKARELLALMQFASPTGLGAKCAGDTRDRMTGGTAGDHQPLTDDRRQQIRAAFEVRSIMRSGSINGRVLRGIFEAVAVARNEGFEFDDDKGKLAKLTGGLVG